MFDHLQWKCREKFKLKESDIKRIEVNWGIEFPNDFKEVVVKYHGCRPEQDVFRMNDKEETFNFLLSFSKEDEYNYILSTYEGVKDRLIDKVYPFANDPGGNLFCFDYRKSDMNPQIVFWDHEVAFEDPEKAITYLCDSFTELLLNLHEYEDEEDE
ncbi:SMI1/KNR4 family protein [Camelliibacillus cellulosilyticus]|uniref:SMI1/KNR4 family protein n=1 Tax=Camelliibacillus cellulosilyticus TaxID=2174486 RepID=A0ABV9GUW5_9BACL